MAVELGVTVTFVTFCGVVDPPLPLLPPLPPVLLVELLAPPPPQAAIERLTRNNAGRIRERKEVFIISEVLFSKCGVAAYWRRPLERPTPGAGRSERALFNQDRESRGLL